MGRDVFGIIPAGAGKRRGVGMAEVVEGDHPRGCGEKPMPHCSAALLAGSSPRVRGKVPAECAALRSKGIIPAGAGKRGKAVGPAGRVRDHPRGCGEKYYYASSAGKSRGSSPRVRGKDHCAYIGDNRPGIIPAGAGKREHLL